MTRRSGAVVGAVVALVALAAGVHVLRRGSSGAASRPAAVAARSHAADGSAAADPARPIRPMRLGTIDAGPEPAAAAREPAPAPMPSLPPGDPIASEDFAARFGGEPRNAEWAAARERDLAEVANKLIDTAARRGASGVKLGPIECRTKICRLTVSADDDHALARVVDWMGDEQGFAHLALQMHVERAGDHGVRVFLRFGR